MRTFIGLNLHEAKQNFRPEKTINRKEGEKIYENNHRSMDKSTDLSRQSQR